LLIWAAGQRLEDMITALYPYRIIRSRQPSKQYNPKYIYDIPFSQYVHRLWLVDKKQATILAAQ